MAGYHPHVEVVDDDTIEVAVMPVVRTRTPSTRKPNRTPDPSRRKRPTATRAGTAVPMPKKLVFAGASPDVSGRSVEVPTAKPSVAPAPECCYGASRGTLSNDLPAWPRGNPVADLALKLTMAVLSNTAMAAERVVPWSIVTPTTAGDRAGKKPVGQCDICYEKRYDEQKAINEKGAKNAKSKREQRQKADPSICPYDLAHFVPNAHQCSVDGCTRNVAVMCRGDYLKGYMIEKHAFNGGSSKSTDKTRRVSVKSNCSFHCAVRMAERQPDANTDPLAYIYQKREVSPAEEFPFVRALLCRPHLLGGKSGSANLYISCLTYHRTLNECVAGVRHRVEFVFCSDNGVPSIPMASLDQLQQDGLHAVCSDDLHTVVGSCGLAASRQDARTLNQLCISHLLFREDVQKYRCPWGNQQDAIKREPMPVHTATSSQEDALLLSAAPTDAQLVSRAAASPPKPLGFFDEFMDPKELWDQYMPYGDFNEYNGFHGLEEHPRDVDTIARPHSVCAVDLEIERIRRDAPKHGHDQRVPMNGTLPRWPRQSDFLEFLFGDGRNPVIASDPSSCFAH